MLILSEGLKFWKVGSRKLYAVKQQDMYKSGETPRSKLKSCKRAAVSGFGSDTDDEWTTTDREKSNPTPIVKECLSEMKLMRSEFQDFMTVTPTSKMPPGLKLIIGKTFMCHICMTVVTPPVAYTRCCQSILGCETCSDMWYSGEEGRRKHCPLCRRERAATETARLHGLNEFLDCVKVFFDDENQVASGTDD